MRRKTKVDAWVDGSVYPRNPGQGGWGALIRIFGKTETKRILLSGALPDHTTNNQAETKAVTEALKSLDKPCTVRVFTDSAYVVKTYQRILKGLSVKSNHDFWEEFQEVLKKRKHDIVVLKITGHSGNKKHDKADRAAYQAAANRIEIHEETTEWQ